MTVSANSVDQRKADATWLQQWSTDDSAFWEARGKRLAWRTLGITTVDLTLAFIVWFVVSALVVRLPAAGFALTTTQLFWLAALPGLAGGLMRMAHTFLVPLFGTRHVVAFATLSLLVPAVGWYFAVQDPTTPYWVLLLLAFLAGLGGGNFSSFMPSTSLFFPKHLQGTALAIQAGVGNFGVSIVQFVTPWIIGFALAGSLLGEPQIAGPAPEAASPIWLQNATAIYVPFIVVFGIASWVMLRSVPVRANFGEQLDIFGMKHGLFMTFLYVGTFGTFSGLAATFPLLIQKLYGGMPGAPDPLAYAFLGPLVGSAARIFAGPLADRLGGARVTQWSFIGLLVSAIAITFFTAPTSMAEFPYFVAVMLMLFFFAGVGNASTFKQMPMIFPPRQAAGVIGWTSAMAAFGPFACGLMLGYALDWFGSFNPFFYWAALFYLVCAAINWWYYARKGAEKPC
ncbi:MAG: MFS transporter [Hyphomicrobium sp.]|uniref:MFS transporter n=1 Tax=Hyphomicrobium sp. TaxID=82 RepID=UPI00132566EC|nr:MFS transporter [Hyphomicrobium sp.]KAB2943148.1 MAG: NarK/NasA family nitrate transporter [Hyphomicrobium sp.]MBZ0209042.1 MFS transporter [Hyphomicrobium sp.]